MKTLEDMLCVILGYELTCAVLFIQCNDTG